MNSPKESTAQDDDRTLVRQMLENERESLELQHKQHDLSVQNAGQQHDLSKQSMQLQAAELKDQRQSAADSRRDWLKFGGLALIALLGTLVLLAGLGHTEIAKDILKTLGLLGGGGGVGYTVGRHHQSKYTPGQPPSD